MSRSDDEHSLTRYLFVDTGQEIPDGELLRTPHAELLERAFQQLSAAYKTSDDKAYLEAEAQFLRDFGRYWNYRIQSYYEAAGSRPPDFAGRYLVNIAGQSEEMDIVSGITRKGQAIPSTMHIFRVEPGKDSWDTLFFEGMAAEPGFLPTVTLDTKIQGQDYPLPSGFHLECSLGGNLIVLDRFTVRHFTDKNGREKRRGDRESIGNDLMAVRAQPKIF